MAIGNDQPPDAVSVSIPPGFGAGICRSDPVGTKSTTGITHAKIAAFHRLSAKRENGNEGGTYGGCGVTMRLHCRPFEVLVEQAMRGTDQPGALYMAVLEESGSDAFRWKN